jgi:ABC-type transporter Mla subunit MlaD
MQPDDRLATRVGALALLVLAAAIGFFVFVYGQLEWGAHLRVRVYFHQIASLHEGAPVIIGGRTIGAVEAIGLAPADPSSPLHGDEGVVVTLALRSSEAAHVSRGGAVFLASRGAFSDRYIELGPALTPAAPLADGDQILGADPPSLDRVLQRTWDNLQSASRFMDGIRPELTALRSELATLSATLHGLPTPPPSLTADVLALAAEAERTRDVSLGGDAGIAHLRANLDLARTTLAELRTTLADLDGRAQLLRAGLATLQTRLGTQGLEALDHVQLAIEKARASIAKIEPMVAAAKELADRLEAGEGTVGKLMHDPEFPEDAKDLGRILKRAPWKIIGHPDN